MHKQSTKIYRNLYSKRTYDYISYILYVIAA